MVLCFWGASCLVLRLMGTPAQESTSTPLEEQPPLLKFANNFVTPATRSPNSLFSINPQITATGYCKGNIAVWYGKCRNTVSHQELCCSADWGPVMTSRAFSSCTGWRAPLHLCCTASSAALIYWPTCYLHRSFPSACLYHHGPNGSDMPCSGGTDPEQWFSATAVSYRQLCCLYDLWDPDTASEQPYLQIVKVENHQ